MEGNNPDPCRTRATPPGPVPRALGKDRRAPSRSKATRGPVPAHSRTRAGTRIYTNAQMHMATSENLWVRVLYKKLCAPGSGRRPISHVQNAIKALSVHPPGGNFGTSKPIKFDAKRNINVKLASLWSQPRHLQVNQNSM